MVEKTVSIWSTSYWYCLEMRRYCAFASQAPENEAGTLSLAVRLDSFSHSIHSYIRFLGTFRRCTRSKRYASKIEASALGPSEIEASVLEARGEHYNPIASITQLAHGQ